VTILPIRQIVTVPGTPMSLSSVPRIAALLTVCAFPENTTRVVVGNADVRARAGEMNGIPLNGGTRPDMRTYENVDLSKMFVDAVTANEGIAGEARFI
jgi:hypothetical protein